MRIGTWVRITDRTLPIPRTLSTAFGLSAGSNLHLAPIFENNQRDVELIVSPVPVESWPSACRLSARLCHLPGALAAATDFLRDHRINILLAEASVTYSERAHWDAICDIQMSPEYREHAAHTAGNTDVHNWRERREKWSLPPQTTAHEKSMLSCLKELNAAFKRFARMHRSSFIQGQQLHAEFSLLPGLNFAHFVRDRSLATHPAPFSQGSISLGEELLRHVRQALETYDLPPYALVTGNTEQRYMRVYFMAESKGVVFGQIEHTPKQPGTERIGILGQILKSFPDRMNLLQLSNYVVAEDGQETGRVTFLAHGDSMDKVDFEKRIAETEIRDVAGNILGKLARVTHFQTLQEVRPRIFVSHRHEHGAAQRKELCDRLRAAHFEPVLASEFPLGRPDVSGESYESIRTTAALISLHTPAPDYKVEGRNGYVPAPWIVAEEVHAAANKLVVFRLCDAAVGPFNFLKDARTYVYANEQEFREKLDALVRELQKFRDADSFKTAHRTAMDNLMWLINPEEVFRP